MNEPTGNNAFDNVMNRYIDGIFDEIHIFEDRAPKSYSNHTEETNARYLLEMALYMSNLNNHRHESKLSDIEHKVNSVFNNFVQN